MTIIYRFGPHTDPHIPSLNKVGGKGRSLIQSSVAGLPVPAGLCLSVEFFRPWTESVKRSELWHRALEHPSKDNCDALKQHAMTLRFDANQKQLFADAYTQLKQNTADTRNTFAVRSSSPEEDLAGTSFAGMYETFLGVDAAQLETKIAAAYSSMFDFRVFEYKYKNDIALESSAISIIIQEQIASEVAGVGFSLNPLNNCFDEVVINASFGLGEAIVAGQVTPDTFIVEKNELHILESTLATKNCALQLKADGGIEEAKIADPSASSLTDTQVIELTILISECERYYQVPVDTEWAFAKGELFLLQVRPITTYIPLYPELLTQPGEPKKLYLDMIGMTQGFDDAMSVLGADVWANAVNRMKQGMMPDGPNGIVLNAHGRQYFQLHNIFKCYGQKSSFGMLAR